MAKISGLTSLTLNDHIYLNNDKSIYFKNQSNAYFPAFSVIDNNTLIYSTTSGNIEIAPALGTKWIFTSTGNLIPSTSGTYNLGDSNSPIGTTYINNELLFNNNFNIHSTTASGSDNKYLAIAAGGDVSTARGASIYLYGNNYGGNEGRVVIRAGTNGSNADIYFQTGNPTDTRWIIDGPTGHLLPALAYNLGGTSNYIGTGYFTNIVVTNLITGSITGNAGTVTNGVYTTGDQAIGGTKTFTSPLISTAGGAANSGAFRIAGTSYGSIIRQDGTYVYILLTNSGDPYGAWNSLRPFAINLGDGSVNINTTLSLNDQLKAYSASSSVYGFATETSDGVDSQLFFLQGGGAYDWVNGNRGATLLLFGNEFPDTSNKGRVMLAAGNAPNGNIYMQTQYAGQGITMSSAGPLDFTAIGNSSITSTTQMMIGSSNAAYISSANLIQLTATHTNNIISTSTTDGMINIECYGPGVGAGYINIGNATLSRIEFTDAWAMSKSTGNIVPLKNGSGYAEIGTNSNRCNKVYSVNFYGSYNAFTGLHLYALDENYTPVAGDAVKLVNKKLIKCINEKDPTCIGIMTLDYEETNGIEDREHGELVEFVEDSFGIKYYREEGPPAIEKRIYKVASIGDSYEESCSLSGARVCNEGGAVYDGDFLCTSSGHQGFLKKQDDDIIHTYTVAQAKEDIIFDENGECLTAYIYLLK